MSSGTGSAARETVGELEGFLRQQRDDLLNFLRHRVAHEADAQDAVQESCTRLLRYVGSQPASAWKPLLYRIAINVAHDQARQRRLLMGSGEVPLDSDELVSPEPSQEQQVAQDQELALIHGVIMRLPPKCRQVYLLHRLRGMSYAAIAAHCAISPKTVEMHMARALSALREAARMYGGSL